VTDESALALYDRAATEAASVIIHRYSTSFGMASRLLEPGCRTHIEHIYALVRIADEIVDGVAAEAGLRADSITGALDELEAEVDRAIASGFSANLIVHAFATTARSLGFGRELTAPFFESMRMDLTRTAHDTASFDRYVYGSAEVVGLMCLRAFMRDTTLGPDEDARLERGARALGAAFQKLNFLRDLAADFAGLGRSYFPGVTVESFAEEDKVRLLDGIDAELGVAASVIPAIPVGSRRAVVLAHDLFAELAARLRATPAAELVHSRVRVPNSVKIRIAVAAATGRKPRA